MIHRRAAEKNLSTVQEILAQIEGRQTPTNVAIAATAHAQAVATSALAQAVLAIVDLLARDQQRAHRHGEDCPCTDCTLDV